MTTKYISQGLRISISDQGVSVRQENLIRTICLPAAAILCMVILTISSGCSANLGKLKEDSSLTALFRENGTFPDFRYYYTGRSGLPYAVIGIDPSYKLESKFWTMISSKEEVPVYVSRVILWDDTNAKGSYILDPAGNRIGIWFSYYRQTKVEFRPDKRVNVYTPYQPGNGLEDFNPGIKR